MLISELAKRTGLTVHTIRFYEKSGLIEGKRKKEVTTNNYLHYDEEVVEKLKLIRDAKSIGFTLREIRQLLDAWYTNTYSIERKLAILDQKLVSIQEKIQGLEEMKKQVAAFKKTVADESC